MTKDTARRIATSNGAALADAETLLDAAGADPDSWFEPAYWRARGELTEVSAGRGAAWFIGAAGNWVLRHYRRGGFMARLSRDRYVWAGETRVRAFAEWRLLAELAGRGLPVPKPIAARYRRRGLFYRCDLITQRIEGARPLSSLLAIEPQDEETWRNIGAAVGRLHAAGADHADLNAHNILIDGNGRVSIIDFDRSRLRVERAHPERSGASMQAGGAAQGAARERKGTDLPGGAVEQRGAAGSTFTGTLRGADAAARGGGVAPAWASRNLARLQRSLAKVARHLPAGRCSTTSWERLMAGYWAERTRADG
jgi:3-deoxy-D-manno-octulosonic acid kinase